MKKIALLAVVLGVVLALAVLGFELVHRQFLSEREVTGGVVMRADVSGDGETQQYYVQYLDGSGAMYVLSATDTTLKVAIGDSIPVYYRLDDPQAAVLRAPQPPYALAWIALFLALGGLASLWRAGRRRQG